MTRDSDAAPDRGVDSAWACDADLIDIATDVLEVEAAAIIGLKASVDTSFVNAVRRILETRGRVIVSGMGKSGIIANKIAATLASTGTPAFFMHPAEALHGDLGMVTPADIFVAISNSGETDELVKLLPYLRDNRNLVVGMTGNPHSTLATHSGIHLSTRVEREACPLQLAPTASTTATLAMGDALAVALMRVRGFEAHHFARFHPGGSLGRRLLKRVRDEMRSDSLPFVGISDDADTVLGVINECRLGVALVCDEDRRALGIITDGDLRRALRAHGRDFFNLLASNLMTPHPVTISIDSTMNAAFDLMAEHAITLVVVLDGLQVAGVVQK